jgi:uncharacterized membrane protein YhaH (DUF805 family)
VPRDTQTPSTFQLQGSLQGRIGRVRYLACGLLPGALLFLCVMVLMTGGAASGAGLTVALGLFAAAALALGVVNGVRRLHDMGRKGWLAIGLLVPVVNVGVGLWLLFAPGDADANRYGPAPGANSRAVLVLACSVPVILVAAVLAAVALTPHKSAAQRAHDEMEQAV